MSDHVMRGHGVVRGGHLGAGPSRYRPVAIWPPRMRAAPGQTNAAPIMTTGVAMARDMVLSSIPSRDCLEPIVHHATGTVPIATSHCRSNLYTVGRQHVSRIPGQSSPAHSASKSCKRTLVSPKSLGGTHAPPGCITIPSLPDRPSHSSGLRLRPWPL